MKTRPNFVQLMFLIPMFCGIVVGCAVWLATLIKVDSELLIANPPLVAGIVGGCIIAIVLSICGILYCYALLVQVIVKHVSYETLRDELDNLLKRK